MLALIIIRNRKKHEQNLTIQGKIKSNFNDLGCMSVSLVEQLCIDTSTAYHYEYHCKLLA